MLPRRPLLLLVVPALLFGRAELDEAALQRLLEDSPFRGESAGGAPTPGLAPLEFRGYVQEGGRVRFSLHDVRQKNSLWLALHEEQDGIRVAAFDAAAERVRVEHAGQLLTLDLVAGRAAPAGLIPGAEPSPPTPEAAPADPAETAVAQQLAMARQKQNYEERRRRAQERIEQVRARAASR